MIIQRKKNYIDKINPFINKHIIKVLIGTRRSGKSTILKQITVDSLIKQKESLRRILFGSILN